MTMPVSFTVQPQGTQLPGTANPSNTTLTQNNFFQLMTTQLSHQDPLNPMSSDQYAAELAQFSTASGVQNMQTTMSNISQQIASASGMQATNLVGHSIAVNGNSLPYAGSGNAQGAFSLPSNASQVVVTIADASGAPVAQVNLGPRGAGMQSFSWNGSLAGGGTASPGVYNITVNALDTKGNAVAASPYAVAPVTGVMLNGQNGPMVELGGGLAPIGLSQIQQIF